MSKPKLPTPPPDRRIDQIPQTLGARYSALRHVGVDMRRRAERAVAAEMTAKTPQEYCRVQSLFKLASAAADAVDATLWLGKTIDRDADRRGVPGDRRQENLTTFTGNALLLVDDLAFEAYVVDAYAAEPSKAK